MPNECPVNSSPGCLFPSSIIINLVESAREKTKPLPRLQEESCKTSGCHSTDSSLEAVSGAGDLERASGGWAAWANWGLSWGYDRDSLGSRRQVVGLAGDDRSGWCRAVGCEVGSTRHGCGGLDRRWDPCSRWGSPCGSWWTSSRDHLSAGAAKVSKSSIQRKKRCSG